MLRIVRWAEGGEHTRLLGATSEAWMRAVTDANSEAPVQLTTVTCPSPFDGYSGSFAKPFWLHELAVGSAMHGEYVLWADADTAPSSGEVLASLHHWAEANLSDERPIAARWVTNVEPHHYNAGVLLFRCGVWADRLIEAWVDRLHERTYNGVWADQLPLNELLQGEFAQHTVQLPDAFNWVYDLDGDRTDRPYLWAFHGIPMHRRIYEVRNLLSRIGG